MPSSRIRHLKWLGGTSLCCNLILIAWLLFRPAPEIAKSRPAGTILQPRPVSSLLSGLVKKSSVMSEEERVARAQQRADTVIMPASFAERWIGQDLTGGRLLMTPLQTSLADLEDVFLLTSQESEAIDSFMTDRAIQWQNLQRKSMRRMKTADRSEEYVRVDLTDDEIRDFLHSYDRGLTGIIGAARAKPLREFLMGNLGLDSERRPLEISLRESEDGNTYVVEFWRDGGTSHEAGSMYPRAMYPADLVPFYHLFLPDTDAVNDARSKYGVTPRLRAPRLPDSSG